MPGLISHHAAAGEVKALLGRVLVRVDGGGRRLSGRIVEVEAYLGGEDKAAHSYQDRLTPKNASMFLDAGHAYVYKSFRGHNDCFNITSDSAGVPAAVLIRALQPLEGVEAMYANARNARGLKNGNVYTVCAGPAKLCQSLAIARDEFDGVDLIGHDRLWVEDDGVHASESEIVATPRINIQYAAEWSEKPLRFCWTRGKRYLSFPLGGTQSLVAPVMIFAASGTAGSTRAEEENNETILERHP